MGDGALACGGGVQGEQRAEGKWEKGGEAWRCVGGGGVVIGALDASCSTASSTCTSASVTSASHISISRDLSGASLAVRLALPRLALRLAILDGRQSVVASLPMAP